MAGCMQVTVRLLAGEANVAVQVQWKGALLNLLRAKEEPVERFLVRLGISCGKHAGPSGGDKKRAKKEKKKPQADGTGTFAQPTGSGMSISLLDESGGPIPGSVTVAEALAKATHFNIEGERLPVFVNPPAIKKLEVFGKPISGCPLVASASVEFCEASAFRLRWMLGSAVAGAGADARASCIGEGSVVHVPASATGQSLTLQAELQASEAGAKVQSSLKVGVVEAPPMGWPDQRLADFGGDAEARTPRGLRVVCFNMLAPPYARTSVATRMMYPYCPPAALDFAYRQPLLGRELRRIDGDILMLQEVSFCTFRKFLAPVFDDHFHSRIMLKASQVSDGCVTMLRKDKFEVLEEKDFLFRRLLRSEPAFRAVLSEVRAKWPDFFHGVLPHMSTVFQLTVARHIATGEVLVMANTHLFYHPLARHIRLLQIMCLLHQVSELREKYRGKGGSSDVACALPRVIFCGDLNCVPSTAAVELLLQGSVSSEHTDWECADQFKWRREDEELDDEDEADEEACKEAAVLGEDGVENDDAPPMPREQWQEGRGVALRNPLGPLNDTYASTPLPHTNFVAGFSGILDYILTGGAFRVVRTLRAASEAELEELGGLPCTLYPSDHLAIAADLDLEAAGKAPSGAMASTAPEAQPSCAVSQG